MKIGIISINAHTKVLNFASPLHSYVFQKFLTELGFDSEIIDYKPCYYGKFDARIPLKYYQDYPSKDETVQRDLVEKWTYLYKARIKRFDKLQKFIDQYYVKTTECYDQEILDDKDAGFDCYICATDVIWNQNNATGFDRGYFLACKSMKGKGKIAYSASRGASKYTPEKETLFLEYISDFDFISVREKSLGNYIESISDIKTTHVLDPILLYEKDFYKPLIKRPIKLKKYVLIYIVMDKSPALVEQAVAFAKSRGLDVIELSEDYENANIPKGTHHKVIYDIGIEEWLGYMDKAEYIFTNSFHCCCFSALFEKQFFVGKRGGDKVKLFLEMFQFTDRTVAASFKNGEFVGNQADFQYFKKKRQDMKVQSTAFLLNSLKEVKNKLNCK